MLGLQFLDAAGSWTNAAEFRIRNPLYAKYPQWTPEPWPATKSDGTLSVTLKEFKAIAIDSLSAAGTHLAFSFAENGAESPAWRIQKLTISDATGNCWSPYLDLVQQRGNWARDSHWRDRDSETNPPRWSSTRPEHLLACLGET